jgi:hypothetical protein
MYECQEVTQMKFYKSVVISGGGRRRESDKMKTYSWNEKIKEQKKDKYL